MLPRGSRLHASGDFRTTIRRGVRVGRPTLVLAVGNAVTRNRVKRRLRHLATAELGRTPAGTDVVVRALPAAATASGLEQDLASAWATALRRMAARS